MYFRCVARSTSLPGQVPAVHIQSFESSIDLIHRRWRAGHAAGDRGGESFDGAQRCGDKARVVLRAGALEFLVFDLSTEHLRVKAWARRVERGTIVRGRPGKRGWWWSEVAFEPQESLVRVRDAQGVLIETNVEAVAARIVAEQAREQAERAQAEERERRLTAEQARDEAKRGQAEEERWRVAPQARLAEMERRFAFGGRLWAARKTRAGAQVQVQVHAVQVRVRGPDVRTPRVSLRLSICHAVHGIPKVAP